MVRNSLFLMLSSGVQASLGFAFWIVVAHVFSTTDVGRASSLISATTVIGYFALLGLNSTLVRYLPTAPNRDALVTCGLLVVAACGAVIALAYVLATPTIAPKLAFVAHSWPLAIGFVLLTVAAGINLLTDSVFIGSRRAGYCALTDGVVGGTTKIVSAVLLAGTGAYGIFAASTGGFAASAVVSVVLIFAVLRWRPKLENPLRTLRPLLKFSGANYLGNILNLLPVLVVPLIVLDRLGAKAAAYYFVAFQIATLLYSAAYAVSQSFLAEGSHAGVDRRALRRRSRRALVVLYLPGVLAVIVAARWVLLVFGARYSEHGAATLILLAVAAVPIAACNWSWTVLRLSSHLMAIVLSSGVYTAGICGLAWFLAPRGLTAVAAAWPIGALLAAVVSTTTAAVSRSVPARHRRADQTRLASGSPGPAPEPSPAPRPSPAPEPSPAPGPSPAARPRRAPEIRHIYQPRLPLPNPQPAQSAPSVQPGQPGLRPPTREQHGQS
jgi:O-antigen/teichoic acid export membrane protein